MKFSNRYVRINTAFMDKKLSAGATKTLLYLTSVAQAANSNEIIVSNAQIAKRTNLTNISKVTDKLCNEGMIQKVERFINNKQRSNGYLLPEHLIAPKDYVAVPIESLTLKGSCLRLFLVYCLYAKENGRCSLSLKKLRNISGMAEKTIISCNKKLQEQGFIAKQRYVTYEGDYGINRVYLTHIVRKCCCLRVAEAFRIAVNSCGTLNYATKCEAENTIIGIISDKFSGIMHFLFRSTKIAAFIRKARLFAVSLFAKWGPVKNTPRYINFIPELLLRI